MDDIIFGYNHQAKATACRACTFSDSPGTELGSKSVYDYLLKLVNESSQRFILMWYATLLQQLKLTFCTIAFPRQALHRVSKNVPPSTCYNRHLHDPITIIFENVTEKVRNQMMLCFPTSFYLVLLHYHVKEETHKSVHWFVVCATKSNCCSTIDFLSSEPCPQ